MKTKQKTPQIATQKKIVFILVGIFWIWFSSIFLVSFEYQILRENAQNLKHK